MALFGAGLLIGVVVGYMVGNRKALLAALKKAAEAAKKLGMIVIGFTGQTGKLKELADLVVISPSNNSAIVQELHLHAIHLICEVFEPN